MITALQATCYIFPIVRNIRVHKQEGYMFKFMEKHAIRAQHPRSVVSFATVKLQAHFVQATIGMPMC